MLMRHQLTGWTCLLSFAYGLAAVFLVARPSVRTQDRNHDGRVDVWYFYDAGGALGTVERDTNFDGRVDISEYYEAGSLVRRESDQNFDDRIDLIEDFDEAHAPVRALVDVDFDGVADMLVFYRAGRPAATLNAACSRPSPTSAPPAHAAPSFAPEPAAGQAASKPSTSCILRELADPFARDGLLTPALRRPAHIASLVSRAPLFAQTDRFRVKGSGAYEDLTVAPGPRRAGLPICLPPQRAPPSPAFSRSI